MAGRGTPCNAFTQAGKRAQKALWAAGMVDESSGAVEKLASGDIIGGLLDLAQAGVSARRMLQSCFAAGTPLLAPGGSKAIEAFVAGDLVLSRDESSPGGRVEAKVVEEVFARTGQIIHLHVGGQVIGTTAEHPFYAYDRGWVRAADLTAGDRLLSHDGRWTAIEEVFDTGEYATLYNLRVADWHTYFVGSAEWGWSAWAHNACKTVQDIDSQTATGKGHSYRDHGSHMTPSKHLARIQYGTKGDGSPGNPPTGGNPVHSQAMESSLKQHVWPGNSQASKVMTPPLQA